MKTILIPTDFSKHSVNAIEYTASLFEKMNAKLVLVHSFQVPVTYTEVPVAVQTAEEIEIETDIELQRLVNQLRKKGSLKSIKHINREGLLMDTLQNLIKEEEADLIVMGTQGASGLEEILIGSQTAEVVEKVACPVLVIPENTTFKKPQKIMYATDFQFKDFVCINKAAEIAKAFEAEIIITHISAYQKNKEEEEDLMDWFMEIAATNVDYPKLSFQSTTGENVLEKLNIAVQELGVDILCMSNARRSFFERFYKSSLTKKMTNHTHIPLLAFHIHDTNRL